MPSSTGSTDPTTDKARRRDDARAKATAAREAAERRQRTVRVTVVSAVAVVVLALVVGIGLAIGAARPDPVDAGAVPTGTTDGGVVTGDAAAPVTMQVYLDYQCPVCRQFEAENADYLDGLRADGQVRVVYTPISILDRMSGGTEYSTRAASAAGCVAEGAPDAFVAWNDAMFAEQPAEGGSGLTDDQVADLATAAGAPASVADCITAGTYTGWAAATTEAAAEAGYASTPTVVVTGPGTDGPVVVQDRSTEGLIAAVAAAAGSTAG